MRRILKDRGSAVLATVLRANCNVKLHTGGRLLVQPGKQALGDVGSGLLVDDIEQEALSVLTDGKAQYRAYNNDGTSVSRRRDSAFEMFFDVLLPSEHLIIVGAGHIAVPLASMGKLMGLEVTVIDDRLDYANKQRFPDVDRVVSANIDEALSNEILDAQTYVVLVTRAHAFDEQALRQIIQKKTRYIGMIGSRRRVLIVYKNLMSDRISPVYFDRVFAPIGIDIGSQTPEEIAVAIIAEIVNVRRGGSASSLRLAEWAKLAGVDLPDCD